MKNRVIAGTLLGTIAGIIDVTPMILQKLTWDANLSAFSMWIIIGIVIATSDINAHGIIKGILLSFLILIPTAIIIGWNQPSILIPISIMTLILGGGLGFSIQIFKKHANINVIARLKFSSLFEKPAIYTTILTIVIILLCTCCFAYVLTNSSEFKNFIISLSTTIIGAGLTFIIFDRLLLFSEEQKSKRISEIVFRELSAPLNEMLNLFLQIYKASVIAQPISRPDNITNFFTDAFYNEIKFFDVFAAAPMLRDDTRFIEGKLVMNHFTWYEYLYNEFRKQENKLEDKFEKYSTYLHKDLFEPTVDIITSPKFSRTIEVYMFGQNHSRQICIDMKITNQSPAFPLFHFCLFPNDKLPLIEKIVRFDKALRNITAGKHSLQMDYNWLNDNRAPKIGNSRINYEVRYVDIPPVPGQSPPSVADIDSALNTPKREPPETK
ncbi:MAG: hypothetical protein WCP79_14305 [Bacillota bacterium]